MATANKHPKGTLFELEDYHIEDRPHQAPSIPYSPPYVEGRK